VSNESFIKKSGQMWKIWLFCCFLIVGLLSFLSALVFNGLQDTYKMYFIFLGSCLFIISILWICFSVRCKNCGTFIVWKAMKEQSHQNWLIWLFESKNCPFCQRNI
jgi:hypothetical protein